LRLIIYRLYMPVFL